MTPMHSLRIAFSGLALTFTLAVAATLTAVPASAADFYGGSTKDYGTRAERPVGPRATTAHGCYYFRGRRHCSRYCYWEYNGHRYCQERARYAYPQADVFGPEAYPVEEVYPRRMRSRWHW